MSRIFENIFCAFCKHERKVCRKKHISPTNVGTSILIALFVTLLIFEAFDPRGIVLFFIFLVCAEVFVHLRWRLFVSCPHCDFDPVLYKQNPHEAAIRVKKKLDEVKQTKTYWLKTKNPLLHLKPIIKNQRDTLRSVPRREIKDRSEKKMNSLFSRTI